MLIKGLIFNVAFFVAQEINFMHDIIKPYHLTCSFVLYMLSILFQRLFFLLITCIFVTTKIINIKKHVSFPISTQI